MEPNPVIEAPIAPSPVIEAPIAPPPTIDAPIEATDTATTTTSTPSPTSSVNLCYYNKISLKLGGGLRGIPKVNLQLHMKFLETSEEIPENFKKPETSHR
jgi:hypothetical protein